MKTSPVSFVCISNIALPIALTGLVTLSGSSYRAIRTFQSQLIKPVGTWSHRKTVEQHDSRTSMRGPWNNQSDYRPAQQAGIAANSGGILHFQNHNLPGCLWFKHLLAFEILFSSAAIMLFLVVIITPDQWLWPFNSASWVRFDLKWLGYTTLLVELYVCVCICLEKVFGRGFSLDHPHSDSRYIMAVWAWTITLVAAVVGLASRSSRGANDCRVIGDTTSSFKELIPYCESTSYRFVMMLVLFLLCQPLR